MDHDLIFGSQNCYISQHVASRALVLFVGVAEREPSSVDFVEPEWY